MAHKWLYLEDDRIIDVILATHIANQIEGDPVWLIIVGPPSSAKTELLRAFDLYKQTFFLSSLTASTLISGQRPSSKNPKPSLLPRLSDKTVILKDFTTVLSMRSEQQQEILSQLREVYDGSYSKAFGTGQIVEWRGKIGFMAACTPIYDKHYGVIGSMGDRFLLYRTNNQNPEKMGLKAEEVAGQEKEMRSEIRDSFHTFMDQFNDIYDFQYEQDELVNWQIIYLASFCAYARCPVERNYHTRTIDYEPQPEGTPRLTKQLKLLGTALAMVNGKNIIDDNIYEIIKKVGRDLIPAQRLKILKYLWYQLALPLVNKWQTTKEIANGVNMPVSSTKFTLEDMMVLRIVERDIENEGQERSPYLWKLTDQIFDWMARSEVFGESA